MGREIRRSVEPVHGQLRALDLHAHQLEPVVAQVDPALQHDDGVVVEEGAVVGHGLGEDEHLDRGVEVLEHEGGHQVALLRVAAGQLGDHPADQADLALPAVAGPGADRRRPASGSVSRSSARVQSVSRASEPSSPISGWSLM